jgi:hypothetical protein
MREMANAVALSGWHRVDSRGPGPPSARYQLNESNATGPQSAHCQLNESNPTGPPAGQPSRRITWFSPAHCCPGTQCLTPRSGRQARRWGQGRGRTGCTSGALEGSGAPPRPVGTQPGGWGTSSMQRVAGISGCSSSSGAVTQGTTGPRACSCGGRRS